MHLNIENIHININIVLFICFLICIQILALTQTLEMQLLFFLPLCNLFTWGHKTDETCKQLI